MPRWLDLEVFEIPTQFINRGAQGAGDLRDVSRAALAAFDLDRRDANLDDLRQDFQHVQAGRFFQRVVGFASHFKAPLAQGRVAGRLVVGAAVNQDAVKARGHLSWRSFPFDVLGR